MRGQRKHFSIDKSISSDKVLTFVTALWIGFKRQFLLVRMTRRMTSHNHQISPS